MLDSQYAESANLEGGYMGLLRINPAEVASSIGLGSDRKRRHRKYQWNLVHLNRFRCLYLEQTRRLFSQLHYPSCLDLDQCRNTDVEAKNSVQRACGPR
jgi:hypothetical protein